ncbi:MAG: DUF1295 domain-containing protein, partial [Clostridia bacterium]|nr:DUF1295 domain-containing protein [Clostridia bacterium]
YIDFPHLNISIEPVCKLTEHFFAGLTGRTPGCRETYHRYSFVLLYLAEIIFWWGIYLFLVSVRPRLWLLGFGALLNTLMFLFISIPMAEKRLAREKDGYEEYAARTRMLLPIKKSS